MKQNYGVRYGLHNESMKEMFIKINLTTIKALTKNKSPETYDRNWWWIVYKKTAKEIPPLRISKISKKWLDKDGGI